MTDFDLRALHDRLRAIHGPQGSWWPGAGTFAMPVSAVLVQRTTWQRAAAAVEALRELDALTPTGLLALGEGDLTQAIRPAGFMRSKSPALRGVARWTLDHDAEVAGMTDSELRDSLLAIRGVGPETADEIAMYQYERVVFIADAYARRLLTAEGWSMPGDYLRVQRAVAPAFSDAALSPAEAAELHGLIVEEGKRIAGHSQTYQVG